MPPSPNNNRRYLCQAPRPDAWDEMADQVLEHLKPSQRRPFLEQTIANATRRNPYTPKVGPGRKTNTEHAIGFYEYLLEKLTEEEGDKETEVNEESNSQGDGDDDDSAKEDENNKEKDTENSKEKSEENKEEKKESNDKEKDSKDDDEGSMETKPPAKETERNETTDEKQTGKHAATLCDVCHETVSSTDESILRCTTCPLAFHRTCTRPAVAQDEVIGDINWRCSYCILASEPKHTKPRRVAAAGVRMMARLRNKFKRTTSSTSKSGTKKPPSSAASADRTPTKAEADTAATPDQMSSSGETTNNKDAATSEEKRNKRARKQPTLYNPQSGPAREWQTDELVDWKASHKSDDEEASSTSNDDESSHSDDDDSKDDGADGDARDNRISSRKDRRTIDIHHHKKDPNEPWCGFCGDDPNIPICCFCACRICFGKHHARKLLLCDRCDEEYHTFCVGLKRVPESSKWYCPQCKLTTQQEKRSARTVNTSSTPTAASPTSGPPRRVSTRKPTPKTPLHETDAEAASPRRPKRSRSVEPKPSAPLATPVARIPGSADQPRTKSGRFAPFPSDGTKPKPAKKPKRDRSKPATSPSSKRKSTGRPVGRPPLTARSGPRPSGRPVGRPPLTSRPVGRPPWKTGRPVGRPPSSGRPVGRPPSRPRPPSSGSGRPVGRPPLSGRGRGRPVGRPPHRPARETTTPAIAAEAAEDVVVEPVTKSRSGRTVKRNTFHDEIGNGEQHLRSSEPRSGKKTNDDDDDSQESAAAAESSVEEVTTHEETPGHSRSNSSVSAGSVPAVTTADARPLAETIVPSSSTAAAALCSSSSSSIPPATVPAAAVAAAVAAPLSINTSRLIIPSAKSTLASLEAAERDSSRTPRRKPGARECMQISRRFGAEVIPDKYMDILLDYCQRGKVEHLIRMRERLDDHARFLESQLAGLEMLVQQKGGDEEESAKQPPSV